MQLIILRKRNLKSIVAEVEEEKEVEVEQVQTNPNKISRKIICKMKMMKINKLKNNKLTNK